MPVRCPCLFFLVVVLVSAGFVRGQDISLEPPEDGFVLDRAGMLDAAAIARIDGVAKALLAERSTPLMVVTIERMSDHWAHGAIRIETFAHLLFDQWAIGTPVIDGKVWNTGILLLVSRDDRKARIQLGAGWGHRHDDAALRIMQSIIVPRFKRGDFPGGIVAGVEALDGLARDVIGTGGVDRGNALPPSSGAGAGMRSPESGVAPPPSAPRASSPPRRTRPAPTSRGPGIGNVIGGLFTCPGLVFLVVLLLILMRRGRGHGGYAPTWTNTSHRSSGRRSWTSRSSGGSSRSSYGGFSGGGFSSGGGGGGGRSSGGGGFSGGGGATGSW